MNLMNWVEQCAPTVAYDTMAAIVQVESDNQPYAIGVVGGALKHQPKSRIDALLTVEKLKKEGRNFSVGLAQINRYHLPKYGISYADALDPCVNLRVGSKILSDCYARAVKQFPEEQEALQAAFSCYYSGNFTQGFQAGHAGRPSYVQKVVSAHLQKPSHAVPSIREEVILNPLVKEKQPLIFSLEKQEQKNAALVPLENQAIQSSTIVF